MTKNKEDLDYDVRIVDRNIREGVVSKKEHDKYIKGLPDVEEKGEPLIFEDELAEEQAQLEQEQETAGEENSEEEAQEAKEEEETE